MPKFLSLIPTLKYNLQGYLNRREPLVHNMVEGDQEWMQDDNVHFVEDQLGRRMWFRLDFARENHQSAPTMLVLHGVGHVSRPSLYAEKHWNTIKPLDQFGFENKGSWWIGVNSEPFVMDLLDRVVDISKQKLELEDTADLFIYGSSMGGYGALLHGARLGAKAVYANVPQIQLLGSKYSDNGMKKHFEVILSEHGPLSELNDLSIYLADEGLTHPLYFICENRFGTSQDYLQEHALKLVDMFIKKEINFHFEIIPTKGHNKNRGIREVRSLFERYCLEGYSE